MKYIFSIVLLSLFSTFTFSATSELKKIDVAAFVYPPFSFVDEQGNWKGADIEITTAVLAKIGYEPNYIMYPFKRLLLSLQEGKVPMSIPIVEGNKREEFVYFSKPISYLYNVLWKLKDRNIEWQEYNDLKDLKIGATKGYHYGAGFKEAGESGVLNIEYMADTQPELKNFKKTLRKRIDMFICEINVGRNIQDQNSPQFNNIDYAVTGVGPKRPFSLAISKQYYSDKSDEVQSLLSHFDLALDQLAKEGVNKRIFEKYNMDIELDKNNQPLIEKDWRKAAES